jgi:hypothetical protein
MHKTIPCLLVPLIPCQHYPFWLSHMKPNVDRIKRPCSECAARQCQRRRKMMAWDYNIAICRLVLS